MRNVVKKAVAVVTLAVFAMTATVPATFAASISDLQKQKNQITSEKNAIKSQINKKSSEKKTLNQQLQEINNEMNNVQLAIEGLNNEISSTENQIAFTEQEIQNKQRDYDGRLAIFNNRLKRMYQYGDVNFMEVLLQSSSITDFLTRFEYLKYVAGNDQKLLDDITEMKAGLESQKASLNSMKTSLEVKKQNQVAKSQELAVASQKQQQLVAQITAEQNALYDELDDLEAESKALNSQIKKLQAEEEARRRAANQGSSKAPGAYSWPCPASRTVTSNYGYRIHPISGVKKLHAGIDIGAGYGSAVTASAGGTVIMAQYYGGYGNCIIVDHGGGVSTLYAHMSSLVARKGQTVSAGQTIGKVGSTGNSTGNHLHFEVRVNGSTVNPRNYV